MKKSQTRMRKHREKRQNRRSILGEIDKYPEPPAPPPMRLIKEGVDLIRPGSPEEAFFERLSNLFFTTSAWLRFYALNIAIAAVILSLIALMAAVTYFAIVLD